MPAFSINKYVKFAIFSNPSHNKNRVITAGGGEATPGLTTLKLFLAFPACTKHPKKSNDQKISDRHQCPYIKPFL
jgi:hypothetical protein